MKIEHLIRIDFLTVNPFYGLNAIKKELLERRALVVQDENKFYGIISSSRNLTVFRTRTDLFICGK